MSDGERAGRVEQALVQALAPQQLNITDESHRHAGHAGARGGGHFVVDIVAEAFRGKSLIERHRMVHSALDALMKSGEVHAVSIHAKSPEELT